jgi:lysophospholipase L1-like esterase
MSFQRIFFWLGFLSLLGLACQSTAEPIRVACIGDSITFGSGIDGRDSLSYPAQLQQLLGPGYEVRNFGVSGRTLLKKGDYPYWQEQALADALSFAPQQVVIMLGTNDTKPQNWAHAEDFLPDYLAMVDTFAQLPTDPEIFVVRPVPAFAIRCGINDSVLTAGVIPAVEAVAAQREVELIDLYAPFVGQGQFFPDDIHPDAAGAGRMAAFIAPVLQPD